MAIPNKVCQPSLRLWHNAFDRLRTAKRSVTVPRKSGHGFTAPISHTLPACGVVNAGVQAVVVVEADVGLELDGGGFERRAVTMDLLRTNRPAHQTPHWLLGRGVYFIGGGTPRRLLYSGVSPYPLAAVPAQEDFPLALTRKPVLAHDCSRAVADRIGSSVPYIEPDDFRRVPSEKAELAEVVVL